MQRTPFRRRSIPSISKIRFLVGMAIALGSVEVLASPAVPHAGESAGLAAARTAQLVPEMRDGQIPLLLEARPASASALADRVHALGGRVTYRFRNLDAVAATVPRDALPALFGDARVASGARQRFVRLAVERIQLPASLAHGAARRLEPGAAFAPLGDDARVLRARTVPIAEILASADRPGERGAPPESFFGYDALTGAAQSWKATGAGAGVVVAIVDTGIYPHHPMFDGNVIGGRNLVPAEEEQAIDADMNGTPDGFSFDWDAIENDGHGTFCAGLVAGHADLVIPGEAALAQSIALHAPDAITFDGEQATIRLRGTAPAASLYSVKVFPYDGGSAPDARVAEAIDRLIESKKSGELDVDVISMSLSGPVLFDGWNVLDRMVDVATLYGITCVCAAANDGPSLVTVGSPGSAKSSLTCGAAMDPLHSRVGAEVAFGLPVGFGGALYASDDVRMIEFSARGLTADGRVKPDLLATGFLAFSSGLADADQNGRNDTPTFGFGSGTSFSTPAVAGAAALVTAYGNGLGGLGTAPFVANVLKQSAVPIDDFTAVSGREQGRGFVHVPAALDRLAHGAYLSPGPDDATHELAEYGSVLNGVSGTTPELAPGTSYTVFLDVPPHVARLVFEFEEVTLSPNANPVLGESIGAVIHTAKRGGAGDYVFETNPFAGGLQPGTVFVLPHPEPGTIRLTFSAIGFNYGPASASFSVRAPRRETFLPTEGITGTLEHGSIAAHAIEVPEGLEAVGVRLSWEHDWRRFPTVDLDAAIVTPEGTVALATLDSPEFLRIEDPPAGAWSFFITDLGSAIQHEPYALDVTFVQPTVARGAPAAGEGGPAPRIVSTGPNPVLGAAEVEFAIPRRDSARLRVFDVAGRLVKTLADGRFEAGAHRARWDGANEGGARVSAGVYFVRLDTSEGSSVRKVMLLE